ncbi:MAG TPA: pirin family protein, partial [Polyangiaceae bacterium]|nr:pirin family protein [Polyangiaceae bacterium]
HSEFNASDKERVHFLQIWLLPSRRGSAPGYEQKSFEAEDKRGRLRLVASPDGADGSVTVRADAKLYASLLDRGQRVEHVVGPGRHAWIQIARGKVDVAGQGLDAGDGASSSDAGDLPIVGVEAAELLVFDLG